MHSNSSRVPRIAVAAVATVFILSACGGSNESSEVPEIDNEDLGTTVVLPANNFVVLPDSDASPPVTTPDRPGGAPGFSHYVFEQLEDRVVTTLVEGPRQKQLRIPISYLQLKELYQSGGATDHLGLSQDQLGALVAQLDTTRKATEKYRDIEVALADGYEKWTNQVPNMGAHFGHLERSLDGIFDPAQPEILLYVQDDARGWELVGTSFVLFTFQAGQDHPDAFVGALDNWHVHYSLCTGPNTIGRSATLQECEAGGGIWVPSYGWMIHAWVWEDNPLGAFTMWNPNISPTANPADFSQPWSDITATDGSVQSSIQNFGFEPLTINVGESLVWNNADGVAHTVTANSPNGVPQPFDSGFIAPGQSFAVRFDKPGQFPFACSLHPSMTGLVDVVN